MTPSGTCTRANTHIASHMFVPHPPNKQRLVHVTIPFISSHLHHPHTPTINPANNRVPGSLTHTAGVESRSKVF